MKTKPLKILALLASLASLYHVTYAGTITVNRSFHDFNDIFQLGRLKHWEYSCNAKPGNQCSCYYRGTYYGDQDSQAKCHTSSMFYTLGDFPK